MTRSSYRFGLILALVLLLALRVPLMRCGSFGADVPNFNDEGNYINQARSFLAGNTAADTALPWMRAPLAGLLLAGLAQLRGLTPHLVVCDFQIVQLGIWAGLLLLLAWLTATFFDRRSALVAAFLVALLPETLVLTTLIYSETLFAALLLGTIAALVVYRRRPRLWLLIGAGLVAGLAALARSAFLPLLPVLMLCAGLARVPARADDAEGLPPPHGRSLALRAGRWRLYLLPGAALLLCCALVIAPWTYRNYRAFGGLILIDTIGAFTLYADNAPLPRATSSAAMFNASPNPVGRQAFATGEALTVIRNDPAIIWRDWLPGSVGTWYPRGFSVTRNVMADLFQRPLVASLLAQIGLLQALVILLLPLGLLLAPRKRPGATVYLGASLGLALSYTAMTAVTHFEERYRTPFLLVLLPYAAWCIAHPRVVFAGLRRPPAWLALALSITLAVLSYRTIWPAQWDNARALALHSAGRLRAAWGDTRGALEAEQAAATLDPRLREVRVAAARLQAQAGDVDAAERNLRAVLADFRDAPDAVVELQRLLLIQGRSDEATALGRRLSVPARRRAEPLAWQRGFAPGSDLRVGGDDVGLVQGFYGAEVDEGITFRWSRPEARLLLAGAGDHLCLNINANRLPSVPAPTVMLTVLRDGRATPLGEVTPPRQGWAWLCRPLDAPHDGPLEVRLETPVYIPHLYSRSLDSREMGVALAEVQLRSGPLAADEATGIMLDRPAPVRPADNLSLIGVGVAAQAAPGETLPMTLWWRGLRPPPDGAFTFVHLLDAGGRQVASYNAPLAANQYPQPWVVGEPLRDTAALPLPPGLPAGNYRLIAGAFDPVSGTIYARAEMGEVRVDPQRT